MIFLIEVGSYREPIELTNPTPQTPGEKDNKGFCTLCGALSFVSCFSFMLTVLVSGREWSYYYTVTSSGCQAAIKYFSRNTYLQMWIRLLKGKLLGLLVFRNYQHKAPEPLVAG